MNKYCPKCSKYYDSYPALCRADNKTEICPTCGLDEALMNRTMSLKEFLEHSLMWMQEEKIDTKIVKKRLKGVV